MQPKDSGGQHDELAAGLGSEDPALRAAAIARVKPHPDVERAVIATLSEVCRNDPSPEVRTQAVLALGRIIEEMARAR